LGIFPAQSVLQIEDKKLVNAVDDKVEFGSIFVRAIDFGHANVTASIVDPGLPPFLTHLFFSLSFSPSIDFDPS
jgi:hypothetical protein